MAAKLSWLHISDIHFRQQDPYDRRRVLQALVQRIERLPAGDQVDLLFVTGDVAFGGKPEEYQAATEFLESLRKAARLEKDRLFVIPGNHDIDRALARGDRTLASEEQSDAFFDPSSPKPHFDRLAAFRKWHDAYFEGTRVCPDDRTCYCPPEPVVVGDVRVSVLCVNSALFCLDDHDYEKLWVGWRCLEPALRAVEEHDAHLRVALIHHPLDWLNHRERLVVKRSLRGVMDVVLRGHLHDAEAELVHGHDRSVLHLAAGACYQRSGHPNNVLLTRIDFDTGRAWVHPLRYEPLAAGGEWRTDPGVFYGTADGVGEFVVPWRLARRAVPDAGEVYRRPFMAPTPAPALVGRDDKVLRPVADALVRGDNVLATGEAGVGKTAAAAAVAHLEDVCRHFTGGVLWAGLGSEPDVLSILGAWATALHVPAREAAALATPKARAARIAAAIRGRRVLVVLDDVRSADDLKMLQFGDAKEATFLVTAQDVTGLAEVLRGKSIRIHVPPLTAPDQRAELLRRPARAAPAAPDEADEALARIAGGVPLALLLLGKHLGACRGADSNVLLARLRAKAGPKKVAGLDDVIAVCVEGMDPALSGALQALSVFPPKPNTFGRDAAAAVIRAAGAHHAADAAPQDLLQRLARLGLVEECDGRCTVHQSVARHAADRLAQDPQRQKAAHGGLVRHYAAVVETDNRADTVFLESKNLLRTLEAARAHGMDRELVRGLNAFYPSLETAGMYATRVVSEHLELARAAAERLGEDAALATALLHLGRAAEKVGDYSRAEGHLNDCLKRLRKDDESATAVAARHALGVVAFNRSDYVKSREHLGEGLWRARAAGDAELTGHLLQRLSVLELYCGNLVPALRHAEEALGVARGLKRSHPVLFALVLTDLGRIALRREHYTQAEEYAEKGWDVASEIGHTEALAAIGQVRSRIAMERGDLDAAEAHLRDALERSEKIAHRWYESYLRIETGKLHLRRGHHREAGQAFAAAAHTAHHIGSRDLEAQAIFGRAQVAALTDAGRRVAAEDALASLRILQEIGHYRAEVVRVWLAGQLVEWGETLLRRLAFDDALEHFQRALAVAPAECDVRAFAAARWRETIERRIQAARRDGTPPPPPPPPPDRPGEPPVPRTAPRDHAAAPRGDDGSLNDPDGSAPPGARAKMKPGN